MPISVYRFIGNPGHLVSHTAFPEIRVQLDVQLLFGIHYQNQYYTTLRLFLGRLAKFTGVGIC